MGKAIVNELLDPNSPVDISMVRIFDVNDFQGISDSRIEMVIGDVRDYMKLSEAFTNIDVVIHSAAIVDWGTKSEEEVLSVNVEGSRNVIKACKEKKVNILVFTSSLDAVFSGKPLVDIDESLPYPKTHSNSYCTSKYLAEQLIITNSDRDLKTCIVRPSDVYGEGDPYHIGSLLAMAKGGFYIRLGDGKSKCQHVYVGNIAYAHVLAVKALLTNNHTIEGNAYFITDGPGATFDDIFSDMIFKVNIFSKIRKVKS